MRAPDSIERADLDSFDLRHAWNRSWSAVLRHKWIVVLTTLFTIGATVAYIQIWPAVYVGEVAFLVEREDDPARDAFYLEWSMFRKDDIESETTMMTSSTILGEVARDLDLQYDEVYHSFLDWTKHLWRESWLGTKYRGVRMKLFPPEPSPFDLTEEEIEFAKVMNDFKKGISTRRAGQSYVGLLSVKASSPRASEIADAIFDRYQEHRLTRFTEEAQHAYDTLFTEQESTRIELEEREEELVTFAEENGLILDFERERVEVKQWLDWRYSILGLQASLAGNAAKLREIDAFLAGELPEITGSRSFEKNSLRHELEVARVIRETSLIELLNRYELDSPEVLEVVGDLDDLAAMIEDFESMVPSGQIDVVNSTRESMRALRAEMVSDMASSEETLRIMQSAEEEMGGRMRSLPRLKQDFTLMAREIAALQMKYSELESRVTQAEVSMATLPQMLPSLRVIEYAWPTGDPVWPRTKVLLLSALIAGSLLGAGLAILRDLYLGQMRMDDVIDGRGDAAFYAELRVGSGRPRGAAPSRNGSNGHADSGDATLVPRGTSSRRG